MESKRTDEQVEEREGILHQEVTGETEATAGGISGGYAAGGFTDTTSSGSSGDPTDEENLKDATTGPASAPGYGVINSKP